MKKLGILFFMPMVAFANGDGPRGHSEAVSADATVGPVSVENVLQAPGGSQAVSLGDTNVSTGGQSVEIVNPDDIKIKNVPSTRAPYANSTNPCVVALSVGASFMGGSGSFGKGFLDKGCDDRQNAMVWSNLGVPAMGLWIMCRSEGTARYADPETCDAMVAQLQIEAELAATPEVVIPAGKLVAENDYEDIEKEIEQLESKHEETVRQLRSEIRRLEKTANSRKADPFLEVQERLREIEKVRVKDG